MGRRVKDGDTPDAVLFDQELLDQVNAFCRTIYHMAFEPEEAEARLKKLPMLEAIKLWQEAGPELTEETTKPFLQLIFDREAHDPAEEK